MIKLVSEVEQEEYIDEEIDFGNTVKIKSKTFPLPLYHSAIYPNLYKEEKWFRFFGNKIVSNVVSLFTRDKIIDSFIEEIMPKSKVLQMGISFGDEIQAVAEQVGYKGRFDIIDVNNNQIAFAKERLGDSYPQVNFFHYDAEEKLPEQYDVIICYMLLHEVPISSKINIVNNALKSIKRDGKVIFVDYGRPGTLHPLAYIVRMFNRLYQPFAEKLWDREIASYAEKDLDYNWKKQRFLGGLYQKVVVTKRSREQIYY